MTDFPHIRQYFTDAYARLAAMRLFAARAADYLRAASADDRRYLLYNPLVKMKVTTQGEEVINLLWDIIAARGFEKDVYFENAAADIRALPKLEGTVHVNMALIVKFMANYFFNPQTYPEIPRQDQPADDRFLFAQGATRGLGGIRFHDFNIVYNSVDLPNVAIFREQITALQTLLAGVPPQGEQIKDFDFLLCLGELFSLVAYGQLIIEEAGISAVDEDLLDWIFNFMVRDFSKYALQLYSQRATGEAQLEHCLAMIKKPRVDRELFRRVYANHVAVLTDSYAMNP